MRKIRKGNNFVFLWAIERGGIAEDLSSVLDAKVTASVYGKKKDITFTINGNIVGIEFTPFICDTTGVYNLELTYTLPDASLSDLDRKCAVDIDAFQIVQRSEQADDSTEFSVTSDIAIGFKGDKGDPFTYEDFTPEQIEALKIKGDKGDPFTYEDFTPEQIESLKIKGDTGPMADVSMTVNESGELIAIINN